MKQFNLDEYLKNPSKKVVTRDGRAVKIHCTNFSSNQSIIAEIEGENCSESFTSDGKYFNEGNSQKDLFFAPEKQEGWVNLYKGNVVYAGSVYSSEEEAIKNSNSRTIVTIKIEWEE